MRSAFKMDVSCSAMLSGASFRSTGRNKLPKLIRSVHSKTLFTDIEQNDVAVRFLFAEYDG